MGQWCVSWCWGSLTLYWSHLQYGWFYQGVCICRHEVTRYRNRTKSSYSSKEDNLKYNFDCSHSHIYSTHLSVCIKNRNNGLFVKIVTYTTFSTSSLGSMMTVCGGTSNVQFSCYFSTNWETIGITWQLVNSLVSRTGKVIFQLKKNICHI